MPPVSESPWPYVVLCAWHIVVGSLGVATLNRFRYGRFSNLLVQSFGATRHHRIQRALAPVSCLWGLSILLDAFVPAFRATLLGRHLMPPLYTLGFLVALASHAGVLFGQLGMGPAFRVGQTDGCGAETAGLVERGLHRWSRNPIYVFCLTLLGSWLWAPSIACAVTCVAHAVAFHLMVLEEEATLRLRFGPSFDRYARRVPRYLGLPRPACHT